MTIYTKSRLVSYGNDLDWRVVKSDQPTCDADVFSFRQTPRRRKSFVQILEPNNFYYNARGVKQFFYDKTAQKTVQLPITAADHGQYFCAQVKTPEGTFYEFIQVDTQKPEVYLNYDKQQNKIVVLSNEDLVSFQIVNPDYGSILTDKYAAQVCQTQGGVVIAGGDNQYSDLVQKLDRVMFFEVDSQRFSEDDTLCVEIQDKVYNRSLYKLDVIPDSLFFETTRLYPPVI